MNRYLKEANLRTIMGWRLISRLFTKRGEVEFGTPENKSSCYRGEGRGGGWGAEDLNHGPSDENSSSLTAWPSLLP